MFSEMANPANSERKDLEWRALQLFCAQIGANHVRDESDLGLLRSGDFADPAHTALFDELLRAARRQMSAAELRRWLPEQMTRLGWPDLDFEDLFRQEFSTANRETFLAAAHALRSWAQKLDVPKSNSDPRAK